MPTSDSESLIWPEGGETYLSAVYLAMSFILNYYY